MPLSFLPIPGLIAFIAVLFSIVKPSLFYEPAWLLPITNTVFVTGVGFIVAYIAMKNYRATGRIQILLLGCGLWAFGIGGIVAGLARSVPGAGANLNVAIYNTGAFIGSIFHFIAAWILLAGISPEAGSKRKEQWLIFGYAGIAVFMGLFSLASLKGLIPPFFIQGMGPTVLRQWVLGSADILFAFSFFIFMGFYLRNKEVFLYWYSSALALTAISLTAFFIESAVGSPVGWAGRISQYLGGIYFLIAILTAARRARARRTSFDNILTASLSPAEEKFRALAEDSPDIIARFDREMKHIYVNPAGRRLYQKPASSTIGKKIQETGLSGTYGNLLKEKIQKVFQTGQPVEMEDYVPTQRGTGFYQSRCVPEYDVDGAVSNVLVVSRDLTERKRMEEELRESEEKSRLLIKYAPSMLYEIDFHRPAFKSVNDAMCQFLGYTREELLVMNPFDLLDDEGKAVFRERIRRKLAGDSISDSVEYKSRTKDGREIYGVLNMTFTYKEGKPEGAVVVAHDITERKRAEERLRRQQAEIQTLLENTPAGLVLFEATPPYKVLAHNRYYQELFAEPFHSKGMVGLNVYEYAPAAEAEGVVAVFNEVVRTKQPKSFLDFPYKSDPPKQSWFNWSMSPLVLDGQVVALVSMSLDVTDRHRAEEALHVSEARFKLLSNTAWRLLATDNPQGIVNELCRSVMDHLDCQAFFNFLVDEEGRRLHLNAYAGIPEEEARKIEWLDYGVAVCGCVARDGVRIVAEDIFNIPDPRTELVKSYGIQAYACHPLRVGDRLIGTLSFGTKTRPSFSPEDLVLMRTVTDQVATAMERMRLVKELRRSRDELEIRVEERTAELARTNKELQEEMTKREKAEQQLLQAQKLESIGTLTGGIAHDFNNILQTIAINADLALLDLPDGSSVRNKIDLILKSGLRGKDLVRQMLLFSRKSGKKQEIITLTPLIKETFKLLRSSLPTTIQMELHLKTESDSVYADPSQIQQVIMNLCTNAAYAMRGTMGSIDIVLQGVTFGSNDLPEADMQPGGYLVLSVKDSGCGMGEQVRKRIFEPFFTTKPVGEGTGLGLSVVYGIVKGHRGNITVYSEPGKGSIFRVYIPKADPGISQKAETLTPIPRGNESILFVDDEEIIVNSVRNMLQHLGYRVTVAMDSREALRLFTESPSQFDLVITDQTMPFMTGEDLGKVLMNIRPDIPVILCTGFSDVIGSEKARAMGFRDFIMKPFTVREGAELVRRVLDQDRSK
jgi:PAS domain S-box-containing protein